MCQAGPRWRPNREIAWRTKQLLLHVGYTNSKRSPSSNAISLTALDQQQSAISRLLENI